jgi:hypothetical protein
MGRCQFRGTGALTDLVLDHRYIVQPGEHTFALDEVITTITLAALISPYSRLLDRVVGGSKKRGSVSGGNRDQRTS